MAQRDSHGRFMKGSAGGPGRKRKKETQSNASIEGDFKFLREMWLTFRIVNKLFPNLKCLCGNSDPYQMFFKLDKQRGRLRVKCGNCGRWRDFEEKHEWFITDVLSSGEELSKEEIAMICQQRGYSPARV